MMPRLWTSALTDRGPLRRHRIACLKVVTRSKAVTREAADPQALEKRRHCSLQARAAAADRFVPALRRV